MPQTSSNLTGESFSQNTKTGQVQAAKTELIINNYKQDMATDSCSLNTSRHFLDFLCTFAFHSQKNTVILIEIQVGLNWNINSTSELNTVISGSDIFYSYLLVEVKDYNYFSTTMI